MILQETNEMISKALHCITAEMIFILLFAALMLFATIVDLKTGVRRAKVMGEQINSGGLKKTFVKFGDYAKVYYFGIVVDIAIIVIGLAFFENGIVFPAGVILCSLGACLTEFKSVRENLRIIKSQAAAVPESIKEIVNCKDIDGAIELINKIKNLQSK